MQSVTLEGIARSPRLRQRASTAGDVATAMAKGEYAKAIATAEITGNPAPIIAMATLILQHQYGLRTAEKATQGLAVYTS